ncbi:hypothetical protein GCM10022281_14950 [Sphingomonas rosea]|uniref:Conjugal transfer protein TraD n=1 Tax=Sphingomonas rosea TaxID=335605 RepID=A0ABP7U479_9SPHN
MRKPKDYDAELKALDERARELRSRKLQQLGELVLATSADALSIELLAGALLAAAASKDAAEREGWHAKGAAFFQRASRARGRAGQSASGATPSSDGTLPFAGGAGSR